MPVVRATPNPVFIWSNTFHVTQPEDNFEKPFLFGGVVQRDKEEDEKWCRTDEQRRCDGLKPNAPAANEHIQFIFMPVRKGNVNSATEFFNGRHKQKDYEKNISRTKLSIKMNTEMTKQFL